MQSEDRIIRSLLNDAIIGRRVNAAMAVELLYADNSEDRHSSPRGSLIPDGLFAKPLIEDKAWIASMQESCGA